MTPDDPRDPTGMRDLLSDLGGPRPMPPELVERIESSLERERTSLAPGSTVVPLEHRRRRLPGARAVLGAAAAAAMVLGGGAVATELVLGQMDGQDSGAMPESDSAGAGAPDATASDPAGAGTGGSDRSAASDFVLTLSGHPYTQATMAEDVRRSVGPSARAKAQSTHSSESPTLGPLTTPRGASDCLESLGKRDSRVVAVDVGTFDGEPGFLLVAQTPGGQRAWAVRAGCELIYPDAYAVR